MSDFRDIVGTEDLDPDEEAGCAASTTCSCRPGRRPICRPRSSSTPEAEEAEIVQFPLLPRRRWVAAALVAATVTVLAFGGGYLFGHSKGSRPAFEVDACRADEGQRQRGAGDHPRCRRVTTSATGRWSSR